MKRWSALGLATYVVKIPIQVVMLFLAWKELIGIKAFAIGFVSAEILGRIIRLVAIRKTQSILGEPRESWTRTIVAVVFIIALVAIMAYPGISSVP